MQDQASPPVVIAQPAETLERVAAFDLSRLDRADLAHKTIVTVPLCNRNSPGEIVVCAVRPEDFSTKIDDPYDFASQLQQGMGLAAIGVGEGQVLAAEVEQADLGAGAVSNRVMIRYKLKF